MILEPSFLAAGQESKRNIKNLSFLVEQFRMLWKGEVKREVRGKLEGSEETIVFWFKRRAIVPLTSL